MSAVLMAFCSYFTTNTADYAVDMDGIAVFVTICAALVSGLGGALWSTMIYVKRENRKFKLDTLRRFAANRYDIRGDEFTRALNEILVAFNDSPEVVEALSEFHSVVTAGSRT